MLLWGRGKGASIYLDIVQWKFNDCIFLNFPRSIEYYHHSSVSLAPSRAVRFDKKWYKYNSNKNPRRLLLKRLPWKFSSQTTRETKVATINIILPHFFFLLTWATPCVSWLWKSFMGKLTEKRLFPVLSGLMWEGWYLITAEYSLNSRIQPNYHTLSICYTESNPVRLAESKQMS